MKGIRGLSILALLVIACTSEKGEQAPMPKVEVVAVKMDSVHITKDFVGQVYGVSDIPIRARLDGFLEGIHFKEGTHVNKGQLLYTIDPEPYEAALAGAKSNLAAAKVELVNAESDFDRVNPLADMKALSERDRDAAIAQKGARESAVDAAEANVHINEIQLGYTKIHAPTDGLIGKTEAKVGEYVGRAPNPVILNTVSRIDSIRVEFFIPEGDLLAMSRSAVKNADASRAARNQALELVFSDGTVFNHRGYIDFLDREVDPTTGTILIQATFPNPDHLIRPGQFVRVRAVVSGTDKGLIIPQRCISEFQGKYNVMLLKPDSTLTQKEVNIVAPYKDYFLIDSGVNEGDKIVFEGLQRAKDGMKVNPKLVDFQSKKK